MLFMLYGLIWPLFSGLSMFTLGSLCLLGDTAFYYILIYFSAFMFPVRGIFYIISAAVNKNKITPQAIIQTSLELVLAAFLVILPKISLYAFIVLYEIYLTFYGAVKLADSYLYAKNGYTKYFIPSVMQFISCVTIFFGIIFLPTQLRDTLLLYGVGVMLTLFGTAHICDFLSYIIKNKKIIRVLSSIRITLPDMIGMSIPMRLRHILKTENSAIPPDAEILFEFSGKDVVGYAGHCELCVGKTTYTYGNYDPSSRHILRLAGDGTLILADRQKYIDWEINKNDKTVISYGLNLSDNENAALKRSIEKLISLSECWDTSQINNNGEFICKMQKHVSFDAYKIKKGRFKTYFAPTTNCVGITNELLKDTRIGRAVFTGINTPGSYMELIERLYDCQNPCIISKTVYTKSHNTLIR